VPNKTIYVSDEDLPLYARAQQLAGGSLSATISRALQRFVERGEAQMIGLEEITVSVGPPGMRSRKRFTGHRVVRWSHRTGQGRIETFTVYRTAKDHYAVHLRRDPDWARRNPDWDTERDWDDPTSWGWPSRPIFPGASASASTATTTSDSSATAVWWEPGDYQLDVYDTIDELSEHLPAELAEIVAHQATVPAVEDLDI